MPDNNNSTKLAYSDKIALSALIFLVVAFSMIYWLIIPAVDNVKSIKTQMANQSLEAEKNYNQGLNLKKLSENVKTIEPRVGEIEQIFIKKTSGDEVAFITSLEEIAARNNLTEKPTLNSAAGTPLGQFYNQIPLHLSVSGSFNGWVGFIADLETLKTYININSLIINQPDLGSDLPVKNATSTPQKILTGEISATTYWEN